MALRAAQRLQLLGRAARRLPPRLGNIAPPPEDRPAHLGLGGRRLSTVTRYTHLLAGGSAGLHGDSPAVRLQLTRRPPEEEEQAWGRGLAECSSSRQVLRLLRRAPGLSDRMAAAALHRLADLEVDVETDVLRSLCLQLQQDADRLTDGGLVSALLACARLRLDPRGTPVARLAAEGRARLGHGTLNVEQLCSLGRALLALEGPACPALPQVMEHVQSSELAACSPEELLAVYQLLQGGAMSEGGATAGGGALLHAMHGHALTLAPGMDGVTVSGLLGALAALEQQNQNQSGSLPLVLALCRQAVRHVDRFTDRQLAAVLGALLHFGHSDGHLLAALERHFPRVAFTARPETVTCAAQYLCQRGILSRPILDAVAESFVYRADDYDTGQVARQIVPLGKLGYLPPNAGQLFGKVESILHTRFSQFQPRTLLQLLHACTLVERFPVNFLSKVFKNSFLQQLQEEGAQMDGLVLAQLTQLYMAVKLECPFYRAPTLPREYRVNSFLGTGGALETPAERQLYLHVRAGLIKLLGARKYFAARVPTPYCYTLDVEIKLDKEGYVLPAGHRDYVHKRVVLCLDDYRRFTQGSRQLLGSEATKQRHLRLLGYHVVQIPFYEFEKLESKAAVVAYLHNKIFPHSFRLSW
ncbi:hypothetical protein CRUP_020049 [Coryphaenoides rupestris]|nr:hypothetical protein CRUP_020049 [Coryphaenoides rupestris]